MSPKSQIQKSQPPKSQTQKTKAHKFLDDTYRLMAPGPVALPKAVQSSFSKPMIHHRVPEFEDELKEVLEGLKYVFSTKQPVLLQTSTGSGAMEACVVNLFSPGDQVIVICSGKSGDRWAQMAEAYGLNVIYENVTWGESLDLEKLKNVLVQNPEAKAVFSQACETSTATLHPIEEMAKIIRNQSKALFIVDAITALGATPLEMDSWGLDVVIGGSQKAFMLPTGLSFIALSERAWVTQQEAKLPKFYFDLMAERKANQKNQTRFSSPVSHIRALLPVIRNFKQNGLDRYQRHCQQLMTSTQVFCHEVDWSIFSKSPSPSVTAIDVPTSIDGKQWRSHIESKYKVTVMGGQDHLSGKILRIGHLGAITKKDQLACLEALALAFNDLSSNPLNDSQIYMALDKAATVLKDEYTYC